MKAKHRFRFPLLGMCVLCVMGHAGAAPTAPVVIDPLEDLNLQEDFLPLRLSLGVKIQDPDGDPLTYTAVLRKGLLNVSISHDTLSLSSKLNINGVDSLIVTATDPSGNQVSDTAAITINAVNDAPVVVSPIPTLNLQEDFAPLTWNLDTLFADVDGDPLTYKVVSLHLLTSPTIVGNTLQLAARANLFGTDTLIVSAKDSLKTVRDTIVVQIASVNDLPQVVTPLVDKELARDFGTVRYVLSTSIKDADQTNLTYTVSGQNLFAAKIEGNDLVLTENTATRPYGLDTLYVVASDSFGATVADTMLVRVRRDNVKPARTPGLSAQYLNVDTTAMFALTDFYSDSDGDSLQWRVQIVGTNLVSASLDSSALELKSHQQSGLTRLQITVNDGLDSLVDTVTVSVNNYTQTPAGVAWMVGSPKTIEGVDQKGALLDWYYRPGLSMASNEVSLEYLGKSVDAAQVLSMRGKTMAVLKNMPVHFAMNFPDTGVFRLTLHVTDSTGLLYSDVVVLRVGPATGSLADQFRNNVDTIFISRTRYAEATLAKSSGSLGTFSAMRTLTKDPVSQPVQKQSVSTVTLSTNTTGATTVGNDWLQSYTAKQAAITSGGVNVGHSSQISKLLAKLFKVNTPETTPDLRTDGMLSSVHNMDQVTNVVAASFALNKTDPRQSASQYVVGSVNDPYSILSKNFGELNSKGNQFSFADMASCTKDASLATKIFSALILPEFINSSLFFTPPSLGALQKQRAVGSSQISATASNQYMLENFGLDAVRNVATTSLPIPAVTGGDTAYIKVAGDSITTTALFYQDTTKVYRVFLGTDTLVVKAVDMPRPPMLVDTMLWVKETSTQNVRLGVLPLVDGESGPASIELADTANYALSGRIIYAKYWIDAEADSLVGVPVLVKDSLYRIPMTAYFRIANVDKESAGIFNRFWLSSSKILTVEGGPGILQVLTPQGNVIFETWLDRMGVFRFDLSAKTWTKGIYVVRVGCDARSFTVGE